MRLSRCLLSLVLLAGCSIDTEGSLDDTPTGLGGQAGVNTGGKAGQGGKSGNNQGGSFPVGGKAGGAGVSGSSGQGGAGASQGGAGNEPGGAGMGGAGVNQGGAGNEPGGAGNAGNEPGGAGQGGAGQGGAGQGGAGTGGAGTGGAGMGGAGAGQSGAGNAGNEPGGAGQGGAGQGGAGAGQGGAGAGQGGAGQGGAGTGGGGTGGTASEPPVLGTAVLWLNETSFDVAGGRLNAWKNKGTSQTSDLFSSGDSRPFIQDTLDGKQVVTFQGSQYLRSTTSPPLVESTVLLLSRTKATGISTILSKHSNDNPGGDFWAITFGTPSSSVMTFFGDAPNQLPAPYIAETWTIIAARAALGAPLTLRINGVNQSPGGSPSSLGPTVGQFSVGAFELTPSTHAYTYWTTGQVAEMAVFDKPLDTNAIKEIEDYLNNKWHPLVPGLPPGSRGWS